MRRRAGIDHHSPTLLNTHTRALIETLWNRPLRTKAAHLHIGGEAYAHQLALGTFAGLLSTQTLVADVLHSLFHSVRVVSTVINRARRHLMRELFRFDKVDFAHFGWILAQLMCYKVYSPLNEMCCLGTTGPTIGIRRGFIRHYGVATGVNHWNVIAATQ